MIQKKTFMRFKSSKRSISFPMHYSPAGWAPKCFTHSILFTLLSTLFSFTYLYIYLSLSPSLYFFPYSLISSLSSRDFLLYLFPQMRTHGCWWECRASSNKRCGKHFAYFCHVFSLLFTPLSHTIYTWQCIYSHKNKNK